MAAGNRGLVDAIRRSDEQWAAAGQNKVLWVLLMVFLGGLVTLVYVFYPRPALKRAAAGPVHY